jgi:hypothetical protein
MSPIGTAARVLQLSRLVQVRGSLAWLCLAPAPAPAPAAAAGKQLKGETRQLISSLSRHSGLPAARKLLELLEGVPAARAADVVAAALGMSPQERLGVLQVRRLHQRQQLRSTAPRRRRGAAAARLGGRCLPACLPACLCAGWPGGWSTAGQRQSARPPALTPAAAQAVEPKARVRAALALVQAAQETVQAARRSSGLPGAGTLGAALGRGRRAAALQVRCPPAPAPPACCPARLLPRRVSGPGRLQRRPPTPTPPPHHPAGRRPRWRRAGGGGRC